MLSSLFGLEFVFVLFVFVVVVGFWVLVAFFLNCRLYFKLLIAMAVLILSQVVLKQLFVSPEHHVVIHML